MRTGRFTRQLHAHSVNRCQGAGGVLTGPVETSNFFKRSGNPWNRWFTTVLALSAGLLAPAAARSQNQISVSLAYDHLLRETQDAKGYQQNIYSRNDPGGQNTPAMREWTSVSDRVPGGMADLVARCVSPVMQARALLLEGGAMLEARQPGSVDIINQKTAQAEVLLNSVRDCWQLMRKYEKEHPVFELNASSGDVITDNLTQDASEVAARILQDAKTGGTPRSDPGLRAAVQN
jgi:hypothetical protein